MDSRSDLILQMLEGIQGSIERVDQRLDRIDQRLDNVEQRLENVEQRIEKVESEQKQQGNHLYQLIANVGFTNKKVDELSTKLEELTAEVKEIKETMATKDDLLYFEKKVAEHDRDIFKLKQRLI